MQTSLRRGIGDYSVELLLSVSGCIREESSSSPRERCATESCVKSQMGDEGEGPLMRQMRRGSLMEEMSRSR